MLQQYGYLAVFVGCLAEGESMLLLGGFAAHRGYLELPWVIATAFVAGVISDQLYFQFGRRHGARFLMRRPKLRSKIDTALRLIEQRGTLVVLGMRFMWGLRIALPMAIGMSGMNARHYFKLDLLAAAIWSVVFASIGYAGTHVAAQWIEELHRHEKHIVAGLMLLASCILLRRWWLARSVAAPGSGGS
ncbi:DedA family protein [Steroidobacter agaridevorans]|uniref:DedA family protein n=1 Tax=Steroidobacter agaridevorans TaxID=2695856 RepID=UPI001AD8FC81|nr:DedA family protein [Steroidobacter agaridevorans]